MASFLKTGERYRNKMQYPHGNSLPYLHLSQCTAQLLKEEISGWQVYPCARTKAKLIYIDICVRIEILYYIHMGKLKYFTDLENREIREIPLLSYLLAWPQCEMAARTSYSTIADHRTTAPPISGSWSCAGLLLWPCWRCKEWQVNPLRGQPRIGTRPASPRNHQAPQCS